MGESPTTRQSSSLGASLGAGAGTAYRALRGKPGRNKRLFEGVRAGVGGFTRSVSAVASVLFLEVTGFIFLIISITVVSAFIREYRSYARHEEGWERVALAGGIGAMFLYFGLSSFWRARRKQKKN
jgi:hypothetical protein